MARPVAAVAALALALAPAARGQDRVQAAEAVGRAAVTADLSAAKDRAKDDAVRGCVQHVASAIVSASADPDQAQLLSEKIYARSLGYVRKLQVLEDRQDGDAWVTRVRCEVSEARLDEDLLAFGIAHRRPGMPRILALISEQAIDAGQATGWWQGGAGAAGLRVVESAFAERMERSGFTVVDPGALAGEARLEVVGAEPDLQQARELGARSGAEIVIVGRAIARRLGEIRLDEGTFHSAQARVSARAVRTDTGEVVATAELTGPAGRAFEQAIAGRDALAEAGRLLARDLFPKLGRGRTGEQSGVRRIALSVKGVDDYARLALLRNALVQGVRGVKDVQERSMGGGVAELEVTLAGRSSELATELATRRFADFAVEVKAVTASSIEVELR